MIEYFQEAFNIKEFDKIKHLDEMFRLDDIMIEQQHRNK
jgi:hypothetical protein